MVGTKAVAFTVYNIAILNGEHFYILVLVASYSIHIR